MVNLNIRIGALVVSQATAHIFGVAEAPSAKIEVSERHGAFDSLNVQQVVKNVRNIGHVTMRAGEPHETIPDLVLVQLNAQPRVGEAHARLHRRAQPMREVEVGRHSNNRTKSLETALLRKGSLKNWANAFEEPMDDFEKFLFKWPRKYHYNVTEYNHRRSVFANTLKLIDERNAFEAKNNPSPNRAVHGITQYADWTPEEFKALLGYRTDQTQNSALGSKKSKRHHVSSDQKLSTAPCTINWGSRGEVRNQGQCGDCWSFSTVELLRSAYIQQHGSDPGPLSTQYLVDCMYSTTCTSGVNGCCGGDPATALKWISTQGGIPTQKSYGDVFVDDTSLLSLTANSTAGPVAPASTSDGITWSGNYPTTPFQCKTDIPKFLSTAVEPTKLTSESDMASYVCEKGSLSILVDASSWSTYVSGVMLPSSCGTTLDHAVLAVGLDASPGTNAWIVQNSWGPNWGVGIDGLKPPKDEYSNCGSLAKDPGCSGLIVSGETISEVCPVSCATGDVPTGGYIYLAYGENTCGIAQEALAVMSTEKA